MVHLSWSIIQQNKESVQTAEISWSLPNLTVLQEPKKTVKMVKRSNDPKLADPFWYIRHGLLALSLYLIFQQLNYLVKWPPTIVEYRSRPTTLNTIHNHPGRDRIDRKLDSHDLSPKVNVDNRITQWRVEFFIVAHWLRWFWLILYVITCIYYSFVQKSTKRRSVISNFSNRSKLTYHY